MKQTTIRGGEMGKKAEGDSERRGKKMQQNGKLEGRRWKGIE